MKMLAPLEIGIACENLDRQVTFYTEVLGCTLIGHVDTPPEKSRQAGTCDTGYRVVRLQTPYGERIKFLQPGAPPVRADISAPLLSRRNAIYVTFIVDDLDTMLRRLKDAGCRFLSGPQKVEVRTGIDVVFARDPEDNVLEFVQFADVNAYRPDLAKRV